KNQELQQFLETSRKMLESAKNSDWEPLPTLESERKKLMVSFFESDVSAENSKDDQLKIEKAINEVLSINEEIEQLAQKEKVTIGQQLHGFKKKQNVHSAYLQNK
ncbi:MAG: flagellar protein FliT, partial [Gammaproteobacteria bacterium]|nr:flagellar protein FliT [Gammaproteobacteria bacterium]